MRAKKVEWPVAVRDRWEAFYQEILRHFGEIAYVIEDDFPTRTVRLRRHLHGPSFSASLTDKQLREGNLRALAADLFDRFLQSDAAH